MQIKCNALCHDDGDDEICRSCFGRTVIDITPADLSQMLQDDLIATLDGQPQELVDAACQVVVDTFNKLEG